MIKFNLRKDKQNKSELPISTELNYNRKINHIVFITHVRHILNQLFKLRIISKV